MEKIQNILVFLTLLFTITVAQEEFECRGQQVNLNEKEKSQVKTCMDQAGITDILKIPMEKLPCFGVCILKEKDMLTADGKINHEKALKYIEDHMKDPATQKMLIDAADKCIKERGQQVSMDNDPNCMTFMEVGQCIHDAFLAICFPGK